MSSLLLISDKVSDKPFNTFITLPNLEDKILKDLRARHSVSTCSNQSFQKSERRKALALNWVAQTVFLIELKVILVSFFSENFPESTSWIF